MSSNASAITNARRFIRRNKILHSTFAPLVRHIKSLDRRPSMRAKIFEEFFAHVEGSVTVGLPEFGGSFQIGHRSHILRRIILSGDYEPDLKSIVTELAPKDRDAIDVGANAGLFAVLIGRSILPERRVMAIEPTPGPYRNLAANVERNGLAEKVILFNGVVGEAEGEFSLNVIEGMEEYSSLGALVHPSITGRSSKAVVVPGETIDRLVKRFNLDPGFMKIDTEGAELLVLRGATETLGTSRPVILSELNDSLLAATGSTKQMVFDLLRCAGYRVLECHYDANEILALPKECPPSTDAAYGRACALA
jgi:FkbM family methyltransferase